MNERNGHQTAEETYPLDEALIELLKEIDEQVRRVQEQANMQAGGALAYFIRSHGLKGNWRVAPNRRELVLAQPAEQSIEPVPA